MRRTRRTGSWKIWILPTALIVGALGIAGYLLSQGELSLPFFAKKESQRPPGTIPVPLNPRPLAAYGKFKREDLISSKTRKFSFIYMKPEEVPEGVITNPTELFGRVLARNKPAGYVFKQSDFLPKGARPGIVAGIPPGKRAMRVQATQVKGLFGLMPGDRFDLIATIPVESRAQNLKEMNLGVYGNIVNMQAGLTNYLKRATVKVIVQNGVVVTEVINRMEPKVSGSLTQGTITRKIPIQEMVIAVSPNEVALLTEAMAIDANLMCVPRSGHPEDPESSITPDLGSWDFLNGMLGKSGDSSGFTLVEQVNGTNRKLIAVPSQDKKDAVNVSPASGTRNEDDE